MAVECTDIVRLRRFVAHLWLGNSEVGGGRSTASVDNCAVSSMMRAGASLDERSS